MKFTILDYSVGNLFSISNAFRKENIDVRLSSSPSDIRESDAIILPGVGSFPAAMKRIERIRDILFDVLPEKYLFGVCLGLQLFFKRSSEGGVDTQGLGFLKGEVIELPSNVKKPHMGWNRVVKTDESLLLENLKHFYFYFAHSFFVKPENSRVVKAVVDYGVSIPAVVEYKNIFGTQFHPEKSGKDGKVVIRNFIKIVKR